MTETSPKSGMLTTLILWSMPLLFCSNLIMARAAVTTVEPFTLAFLRWLVAFAMLMPIAGAGMVQHQLKLKKEAAFFGLLGFLAMGICGAGVYVGLARTTASNATLIYTSSPIFILLLEAFFRGRKIQVREVIGIVAALAGITMIVVKGSMAQLMAFQFNPGDMMILMASIGWAIYSVLSRRREVKDLPTAVTFATVALAGLVVLAPGAAMEIFIIGKFPQELAQWQSIVGLAFFSSVLAFLAYQHVIKTRGAAVAGIYMYLMPPYGVLLAVVFLGETLETFHYSGFALILGGLIVATIPLEVIRARLASRPN